MQTNREQTNKQDINCQEQVDDFLLSLLLHSSGTPIRIVVITDIYSLSGDSEQSISKYFIPFALSRSQHLAGQQQIEGVDQGGGAQHEGQELHNSKSQFCVCQH